MSFVKFGAREWGEARRIMVTKMSQGGQLDFFQIFRQVCIEDVLTLSRRCAGFPL